jgi:hypothetical protein
LKEGLKNLKLSMKLSIVRSSVVLLVAAELSAGGVHFQPRVLAGAGQLQAIPIVVSSALTVQ